MSEAPHPNAALKTTPLCNLHRELTARMAPFAGYDMPIQYPSGIIKEHLHTRRSAGLFDVSHMGQVEIRPRSGEMRDAALALEAVMPVDVVGLKPGRQRYGLMTNDAGGIVDDLMISHCHDHFLLVVNASRKDIDTSLLTATVGSTCTVERRNDRALIALQGPSAEPALAALSPAVAGMKFMDVQAIRLLDNECIVARSGYTGEDGFEISMPAAAAEPVARRLLQVPSVAMIGLGARDSLRLEAGLCLYGADINEQTTPIEGALDWAIQKVRRSHGERAGGFPGANVILDQMKNGPHRVRVGFAPVGKNPVRGGAQLFASDASQTAIGTVTSGSFSPSTDAFVAMGYVDAETARGRPVIFADVRGKRTALQIVDLPFIAHRYRR